MDILEKPPKRKWLFLRKYLWIILCSLVCVLLLIGGYAEGERYREVAQKAVTVTAEVTHFEEDWDSEYGKEYDTYMSYSYNGHTYTKHHNTYSSENKAISAVGQTLQLQINPEDPVELVEDVNSTSAILYLFGGWTMGLAMVFVCLRDREHYVVAFGWLRQYAAADLSVALHDRAAAWLSCMVASAIMFGAWVLHGHPVVAIVAGSVLLIGLICLAFWLRKWQQVRNEDYRLATVTLVDKSEKRDSDGAMYFLHYSDGDKTWKRSTNWKTYQASAIGDTMDAIYLGSGRRPFLMYSKKWKKIL